MYSLMVPILHPLKIGFFKANFTAWVNLSDSDIHLMNLGCHQLQHGNKPCSPPPPALYVITAIRYLSGRLFCLRLLPEDVMPLGVEIYITSGWNSEILGTGRNCQVSWADCVNLLPLEGLCLPGHSSVLAETWLLLVQLFCFQVWVPSWLLEGIRVIWKGNGLLLIWGLLQIPWCQTSTIPSLSSEEAL